jgi:hypothetical protein
MTCPECGAQFVWAEDGWSTTLVGYFSPSGHDHDDNCRLRSYQCANGHRVVVSIRCRCHACEWVGKDECFCHNGKKVDAWPELTAVPVVAEEG